MTAGGLLPGNTVIVAETKVLSGYVLSTTPRTIGVRNGADSVLTSGARSNSIGRGEIVNGFVFENDPMTLTIHKYIEGTANELLAGVAFKIVDGSGAEDNSAVDTANGVISSNGIYITDTNGEIRISGIVGSIFITMSRDRKTSLSAKVQIFVLRNL